MPPQVVAVGELGAIYQRDDGSRYYADAFGIGAIIECGARALADCARATIGTVFRTLDPYASIANTVSLEAQLAEQLSLEARSVLSFLPANTSPTLSAAIELAAQTGLGLVPLLQAVPALSTAINAEASQINAEIIATTPRDPRDGKTTLEQYLDGVERSRVIEASPVVQQERAKAMGFLDQLALSSFSGGGFNTSSFLPTITTGTIPGPSQPESFLGSIVASLPSLLSSLAQAGVIRGSVGQAFAPNQMQMSAVGMVPAGFAPSSSLASILGLAPAGTEMGVAIENMLGLGSPQRCGGPRPAVSAPSLFRTNNCGRSSLPARQQVVGPDGAIYVIASLGRATRGASEGRVMRRLARDNGFTCARKGTGSRRARRRPR
jgi:hypothetical protein